MNEEYIKALFNAAAIANPEIGGRIDDAAVFGEEAYKAYKQQLRKSRLREAGLPDKRYQIIYADPDWGKIEEICNLPIAEVAEKDSALFLWVEASLLFDAGKVMEVWGFKYTTVVFNWVKRSLKGKNSFILQPGAWTRTSSQICLLGLKGMPRRAKASVPSLIISPVRDHSQKPAEARDRIVQLMGDIPRIELFAREKVEGWDAWGNEV